MHWHVLVAAKKSTKGCLNCLLVAIGIDKQVPPTGCHSLPFPSYDRFPTLGGPQKALGHLLDRCKVPVPESWTKWSPTATVNRLLSPRLGHGPQDSEEILRLIIASSTAIASLIGYGFTMFRT
jgi:hypothetical protein